MTDAAVASPNELSVDVQVDSTSPTSRRLKVTVQSAEVDRRLEEAFASIARDAALPGFRRGKVPRAMLERRFGPDVARDTRDRLIGLALSEAIRKAQVRPLGEPELPKGAVPPELERGRDYVFEVDLEVMPDFELPKIEGLKIRKPVGTVPDAAIDAEIERQRRWFGNPERISGPFEAMDRMIGPVKVFREGVAEPFFTADDALATVPTDAEGGRGQFLGVLVDGLAAKLKGRKIGDAVVIETIGPEGHELPEVRGAKLRMEYEIRDAERIHPASNEEVAAALGLPSADDVRPQVKLALEDRMSSEQRGAMREQVAEQLVGATNMALPEKLSTQQATSMVERRRAELLSRGLDPERLETELARFRQESEPRLRDQLKLSLILIRVAEQLGVTVSENEVNARIARLARQRGERPDQLRNELAKANRIGALASDLREQKTLDRIIDKAEVTETSIDEWNADAARRATR